MDVLSIIEHKKYGLELTGEEISFFIRGATDGSIPDYQLAALLMAIRLNGMTDDETTNLTRAMTYSGHVMEADVGGVPVDKHSTGGVGDTVTLVAAPLVAACGGKVLKMSGRGLGHTGGTLDKLESIPGMSVNFSEEAFAEIVRRVGCAVVGQSAELAPADKVLYALRDVTCTVDSIPLITSSILSKKFAAGARAIVLDVKTGSGAMMKTWDDSLKLAQSMVRIGALAGRSVTAVITEMSEPLGSHVGNALEVKEAIDVLSGKTAGPLLEVSLYLSALMLTSSGVCATRQEATQKLEKALKDGSGLRKLGDMIEAQGGDRRVCEDPSILPKAKYIVPVTAREDGCIAAMDTAALGMAAQRMGAGRAKKDDIPDPAVGFVMEKRIGESFRAGDTLFTLHASGMESAVQASQSILAALTFSAEPVEPIRHIKAVVTAQGTDLL